MLFKRVLLVCVLICTSLFAHAGSNDRYIFFLHNKFIEDHALNAEHPQHGRAQYEEILSAFRDAGFTVISEKRESGADIKIYALGVKLQIDALLEDGVEPERITVVGTSKGGLIAQYVSTYAGNNRLNYVFIGSSFDGFLGQFPDMNLCGNILAINEASDPGSVSLESRMAQSSCENVNFKNIELETGFGHGFLFQLLDEWFEPTVKWANGDYA